MIRFTKMHGLGNDFVGLDEFAGYSDSGQALTEDLARRLADRHFGVGCDQILVIGAPSREARAAGAQGRMEIWNTDGSRAEMCGNGIRAVALYLHDHGPAELCGRSSYSIETGAGLLSLTLVGRDVRVNMGAPRFSAAASERLETSVGSFEFWEVNMGNPHAVIFVPSVTGVDLERVGPVIETHSRFPRKTNVEFVEVLGSDRIRVRVWERGAGVTLACGTGACASAVASILAGKTGPSLRVELPGGVLGLEWAQSPESPVWMTGPATEVFRGEWN